MRFVSILSIVEFAMVRFSSSSNSTRFSLILEIEQSDSIRFDSHNQAIRFDSFKIDSILKLHPKIDSIRFWYIPVCWFVPRDRKPDYAPLRPVARTVRGTDSKPRAKDQVVHALGEEEYQEEIVCYMCVHKMSHPPGIPGCACHRARPRTTYTTPTASGESGVKCAGRT